MTRQALTLAACGALVLGCMTTVETGTNGSGGADGDDCDPICACVKGYCCALVPIDGGSECHVLHPARSAR